MDERSRLRTALLFLILALVVVVASVYVLVFSHESDTVTCSLDAKLCPDGSAVGREGPNCEFAECPGEIDANETINTSREIEFYLAQYAQKPSDTRDAKRVSDIGLSKLGLEFYFDKYRRYPSDFSDVITYADIETPFFLDPLDGVPYAYTVSDLGAVYHIGVSLETEYNVWPDNLHSDADCNSITGVNCATQFNSTASTNFDGDDSRGCFGEPGRHCLDFVSQ